MWQVNTATRARRRRSWLTVAVLVPAIALGLTACGDNAEPPQAQVITDKGTPFGDLLVPKLTASVQDGAVGVSVDSPVTVSADYGVLGAVTMVNEDGEPVAGQLSEDGLTWETAEPLGYNKSYTLTAQSLGLGGVTSSQMTFETHSPENLTMPYVLPNDGEVVGVGQPVAIQFDENIPNRLAAQRAITVKTTPPVEGAFYWLNNREVRWRPAKYWKPGTTVEVAVNTYGVDLGDGLFGQDNVKTSFKIGDEVITTVDDNTKTLTVRRNGEVIKSMPVSMGKNSTPTNNGVYIVGDRRSHMVMDSSTYGVPANSPNGYRTEVDWATQISYSGIYVHAAPWSVGSQGYSNVSHGCINVSTSNGQWFYDNSKRGDIVEIVNTVGSPLSGTDGLGDWNIPWDQWKAGNANL
ncbi:MULTISPECIES: L,D-transpeptidase [Mycolicibacterium]|jgi:lipoprotein-anchoring transpeptidase ErfK/SrfK|uniref:ErfK/YbiS/YcfS/YnhG family protein n=1 Tax=Mycolicibacterium vanbaalenii (strain DSM 7251 / JCM 13017 / BCRC 16820 / KCTC 9966 / NRRL B-24157 / PYR-1) TaxID=350058 RepID=A1TCH9_MYCVP|nr:MULTISPECIES: Ig-like domain-containing protein [Mycolicibacterium]ABM14879.1 ErfK/YbiS/YcfS/YnhG family protein [Mycolicibacterium vanbaalenii PYR-1]MCV7130565.1 L,D-transpeptidase [Mycolicibacterium vanbaalenii PYR-1]QZT55294.1 L,D-transpeptidase family protein [Mycolicibacterium austroafricanum]